MTTDGAGNWTFQNGGGSISGSGVANEVTYWTGTSTVAGNSNFTWNNGTQTFHAGGSNYSIEVNGSSGTLITSPTSNSNALTVTTGAFGKALQINTAGGMGNIFTAGDTTGINNKTIFTVNDGIQTIVADTNFGFYIRNGAGTTRIAEMRPNVTNPELYFGDLAGVGNGNVFKISDFAGAIYATVAIDFYVQDTTVTPVKWFDVQVNNHKTIIGDSAGAFNNTQAIFDDTVGRTTLQGIRGLTVQDTSANQFLSINPFGHLYEIGDLGNSNHGTRAMVNDATQQITLKGGLILPNTIHTNANYTILPPDQIIEVDTFTSGGPVSIVLPNVSTANGEIIIIKDSGNNASINNINITASSGGVEVNKISTNGKTLVFYADNTTITWRVVSSFEPSVSPAFSSNDLIGQTSAVANVLTVTSPNDGNAHTYSVGSYLNITAVSLDVVKISVSYTDENGTGQTEDFFPAGLTSALVSTIGNFPMQSMTIRVNPNTAITIKTILTTGIGSITYDVGGWIQQVN